MVPSLQLEALSKRYSGVAALDEVQLTVADGTMRGFLGPNGAGKTTAMRAILGLVSVDGGVVRWDGAPITEHHRSRIGYLPQQRGLYARMRVEEQVSYFGRLAGLDRRTASDRARSWIERVGLTERSSSLVQELSVGNQQRVQLAVALVHEPELLVLDEPFAGLDPVAVATMSAILAEQVDAGVTVLFSSHQLDLVQDLCEDVTIIAAGRTVGEGTVSELRQRSDRRELEIRWKEPVANQWILPEGAERIETTDHHVHYRVSATTDPAGLARSAASLGDVVTLRLEPPRLEEVFLEMVS